MVPSAATANDGVLTVSGVGSVVTLDTTAAVTTSIASTVSLEVAANNVAPSGLSTRLRTGAPTLTDPITVVDAAEITETVPPRPDTYTLPPPTTTSLGEIPTPLMVFVPP